MGREYIDGCIRDEQQARLSYRFMLVQAEHHGIVPDYRDDPHTRVYVDVDEAVT